MFVYMMYVFFFFIFLHTHMIFQCKGNFLKRHFFFSAESYLLILWLDAGVSWAWVSWIMGSSVTFTKSVSAIYLWCLQLNYLSFATLASMFPSLLIVFWSSIRKPRCSYLLFSFVVGLWFYHLVPAILPSLSSCSLLYILAYRYYRV